MEKITDKEPITMLVDNYSGLQRIIKVEDSKREVTKDA